MKVHYIPNISGRDWDNDECIRQMAAESRRALPCIDISHSLLRMIKAGEAEADLLLMTYLQRLLSLRDISVQVVLTSRHVCESSSHCLKLAFGDLFCAQNTTHLQCRLSLAATYMT